MLMLSMQFQDQKRFCHLIERHMARLFKVAVKIKVVITPTAIKMGSTAIASPCIVMVSERCMTLSVAARQLLKP